MEIPVSPKPCQHLLFSFFVYLLNHSHPNGYRVVSHCGFHLHFPNDYDVEHLSMCLFSSYISPLEKCLSRPFPIFELRVGSFFFFCCIVGIIYIFWINIFYKIRWFANIFSYSVSCLFTFLLIFFSVQMPLIWGF